MSTATVMLLPAGPGDSVTEGRGEFADFVVRLGNGRPAHAVYVRRRLLVGLVVVGLFTVLGVSARSVLADRGGVPASTSTVRPVNGSAAAVDASDANANTNVANVAAAAPSAPSVAASLGTRYIVQPGDTLWSLGELFHGSSSVGDYVDALVAANGGAALQVGQLLTLP